VSWERAITVENAISGVRRRGRRSQQSCTIRHRLVHLTKGLSIMSTRQGVCGRFWRLKSSASRGRNSCVVAL
jgi:hypothetical protein